MLNEYKYRKFLHDKKEKVESILFEGKNTIDTLDIYFQQRSDGKQFAQFLVNGEPIYEIRLVDTASFCQSMNQWLDKMLNEMESTTNNLVIDDEYIYLFFSCDYIGVDENTGEHLGVFTMGDDWDGLYVSCVALIETTVRTFKFRLKE